MNRPAKTKTKQVKRSAASTAPSQQLDSVYVLKLVMFVIIGAMWLRLTNGSGSSQIPLPLGLVIGLAFAAHDHFRIDRKIEYAVLIIAALVGYSAQIGLFITLS